MGDALNPGMVNRVDRIWSGDESLPALVDAAEAVERMMDSPGWEAVQRLIGDEIASMESSLDRGAPKSEGEYAKAHGRKSALRAADDAARAIVGRAQTRARQAQKRAVEANERAGESVLEETMV